MRYELIDETPTLDPRENLRREERYWKTATVPAARVWRNRDCVVLGRFLAAEEEVRLERAAACSIPVLKRTSGGGAVFHDEGNLNYSLYLPEGFKPSWNVEDSLARLSSPVRDLLDSLDLPWTWVAPNNLYVNGRKISGSAQARSRGRILHHGTMLVSCDLDLMADLLKPGGRSRTAPVTNLAEERPGLDVTEVAARLREILCHT
jgi:lipoate---protein ligase